MESSVTVTGENLKALTHPLRVQVLGLLRTYGPATATTLARRLGLTSGALSYHLRQLERYGFIAEDAERGNERDRWWRAIHRSTDFEPLSLDPAAAEAGEAYEQGILTAINRSLAQALADRPAWPAEWQRALTMSDVLLELTPAEAEQLQRELLALLNSYPQLDPDADPRPGAWSVNARFQVVPVAPDEGAQAEDDR
jgi:DNA-binding transcriptional ArsR family regulator